MVSQNSFIKVELYILSTFDDLIKKLTIRRERLLNEIEKLKSRYELNEKFRKEEFKKAEVNIKKMEDLGPSVRGALNCLRIKRDELQDPIPPPIPQLDSSKIKMLEDCVNNLFLEYKFLPKQTVGKKGTGELEFDGPRGIATDGEDNLYVAEMRTKRIQVLSSDCEYENQFGKDHLKSPHSVVIHTNCAFVTDRIAHAIVKFALPSYEFKAKCETGFETPLGLDADSDGVYVANSVKNSVAVLNIDLASIEKEIGSSQLKEPVDVKVYKNNLFVAEKKESKILIFSKSGELKETLALTVGIDFLCFGRNDTLIVCDSETKLITIFTAKGDYLFHIETDYKPTGLAVKSDDTILCSDKANHKIQMY